MHRIATMNRVQVRPMMSRCDRGAPLAARAPCHVRRAENQRGERRSPAASPRSGLRDAGAFADHRYATETRIVHQSTSARPVAANPSSRSSTNSCTLGRNSSTPRGGDAWATSDAASVVAGPWSARAGSAAPAGPRRHLAVVGHRLVHVLGRRVSFSAFACVGVAHDQPGVVAVANRALCTGAARAPPRTAGNGSSGPDRHGPGLQCGCKLMPPPRSSATS